MTNEKTYYTYLDECKNIYLTNCKTKNGGKIPFQEYSVTSITFEKEKYQLSFEPLWEAFCKKYNGPGSTAMHFVEYKKLTTVIREKSKVYKHFLDKNGNFNLFKVKSFFWDLHDILKNSDFFIVHVDCFYKPVHYYFKKDTRSTTQTKVGGGLFAIPVLKQPAYITMQLQLDLLMRTLVKSDYEGEQIFDVNVPSKINTKLRFDSDGKQFQARDDIKSAYIDTLATGSQHISPSTAKQILDEIRFIRKEEVGHCHYPNHCGLEVVDFLCSMISGEMRMRKYLSLGYFDENEEIAKPGNFMKIKFDDGSIVDFTFILDRIRAKSISELYE